MIWTTCYDGDCDVHMSKKMGQGWFSKRPEKEKDPRKKFNLHDWKEKSNVKYSILCSDDSEDYQDAQDQPLLDTEQREKDLKEIDLKKNYWRPKFWDKSKSNEVINLWNCRRGLKNSANEKIRITNENIIKNVISITKKLSSRGIKLKY